MSCLISQFIEQITKLDRDVVERGKNHPQHDFLRHDIKSSVVSLITSTKTYDDLIQKMAALGSALNWVRITIPEPLSAYPASRKKDKPAEEAVAAYLKTAIANVEARIVKAGFNMTALEKPDYSRTRIRCIPSKLLNLFVTDGEFKNHPCVNISDMGEGGKVLDVLSGNYHLDMLYNCDASVILTEKDNLWHLLIIRNVVSNTFEYLTIDGKIPTFPLEPLPILYGVAIKKIDTLDLYAYGRWQHFGTFIKLYSYRFTGGLGSTSVSFDFTRFLDSRLISSKLEVNVIDRKSKTQDTFSPTSHNYGGLVRGLKWRILKEAHLELVNFNIVEQVEIPFENTKIPTVLAVLKNFSCEKRWRKWEGIFFTFNGFAEAIVGKEEFKTLPSLRPEIANKLILICDCDGLQDVDLHGTSLNKIKKAVMNFISKYKFKEFKVQVKYDAPVLEKMDVKALASLAFTLTVSSPFLEYNKSRKTDMLIHNLLTILRLPTTCHPKDIVFLIQQLKEFATQNKKDTLLNFLVYVENKFDAILTEKEHIEYKATKFKVYL